MGQKVAVKDRLARIVLVLNPNSGASVGWNNDRVTPDFGIEFQHLGKRRVVFDGEFRSQFLDLEAIDVNMELKNG